MDQDVLQIYYNKNIKLFSKNLVDIALKTSWCIGETKRHYLILEVAIFGAKGRLLLVIILDSYLMIGSSEIQLYKLLGLA